MPYKVINTFNDNDHKTLYNKGETYPKEGFEENPKRIKELQGIHPKYKRSFLADTEISGSSEKESEKPSEEPEKVELDIESLSREQLKAEVNIPQLKEYLDEKGIEYKASAKKDDLIDLIKKEE